MQIANQIEKIWFLKVQDWLSGGRKQPMLFHAIEEWCCDGDQRHFRTHDARLNLAKRTHAAEIRCLEAVDQDLFTSG